MNASKRRLLPQPQTLFAELERLSDQLESALAALKDAGNDTSHQARAALIERIAAVLAERGTVLDSFETWVRSTQSTRAPSRGRLFWQEALEHLQRADSQRAKVLNELIAAAVHQLQQRIAQRALFIYNRGAS